MTVIIIGSAGFPTLNDAIEYLQIGKNLKFINDKDRKGLIQALRGDFNTGE